MSTSTATMTLDSSTIPKSKAKDTTNPGAKDTTNTADSDPAPAPDDTDAYTEDIDLAQARALSDLIAASVNQLIALSQPRSRSSRSQPTSTRGGKDATPASTSGADATGPDPGAEANGTDDTNGTDVAPLRPTLAIVAAAAQLVALVRPPAQAVMDAATGFHLSTALRLVVEAHIVEIIRARGVPTPVPVVTYEPILSVSPPSSPEAVVEPLVNGINGVAQEGADAKEVKEERTRKAEKAEKVTQRTVRALHVRDIAAVCGVDAYKLARLLRLLATHHIFTEVAPDTFANNRLSAPLDTGKPLEDILARPAEKYDGSSGLSALVGITTDESHRAALALPDALLDPARTASRAPLDAPFSAAWPGAESRTMFEWLSLPEHTDRLMRFGNAMKGMSGMTPEDAILRGFDWSALPAGSVVVDVGGGVGAAALPIARACPRLRLVVQDTARVVEQAPTFWRAHLPEALEEGRVAFQVQDFFAPQLPLPRLDGGEAVFLLRMIMHNWPDAEAARILAHVRAAAEAHIDAERREGREGKVRLVLVDSILMYACRGAGGGEAGEAGGAEWLEGGEDALAPEPLLANWGTANALAYKLDIQMLNNHNAGERTLGEFGALLARTGWRVERVHAAHQSWMPQIVAVPAPVPASESSTGDAGAAAAPSADTPAEAAVTQKEARETVTAGIEKAAAAANFNPVLPDDLKPKPKSKIPALMRPKTAPGGLPADEKQINGDDNANADKAKAEKKRKRRSFWKGLF